MDIRAPRQRYNPYRIFSRPQWAALRDDTPMMLEPGEFSQLRSLHDRLDIKEVEEIYLPLSRLLSISCRCGAAALLCAASVSSVSGPQGPIHHRYRRLGCSGQVDHRTRPASAARTMVATAQSRSGDNRWLSLFQSGAGARSADAEEGISGELRPGAVVVVPERHQSRTKSRRAPVYSHLTYDIVPNQWQEVNQPDILIVEGVNVLQTAPLPRHGRQCPSSPTFSTSPFISTRTYRCCAIGTCSAF